MEVENQDLPIAFSLLAAISWPWKAKARVKLPDEEFFDEGNVECMVKCKFITEFDDIEDDETKFEIPSFPCHIAHCGKTFTSVVKYEMHYQAAHRNVCRECRQCLPTGHLLDIHILELHNPMFEIQSQHQAMYQCLLEHCQDKFTTAQDRKEHLMKTHKYPANFRFHRPVKNRKPIDTKRNKTRDTKVLERGDEDSNNFLPPSPMDTEIEMVEKKQDACTGNGNSGRKYTYKVPENICFGKGSTRTFSRQSHGGKKQGRKNPWHQTMPDDTQTKINIEEVKMMDLADALS